MVDIAKPDYGSDEDFSLEYAMKTMVTLDRWLEQGVMEVLVDADSHMEDMLRVASSRNLFLNFELILDNIGETEGLSLGISIYERQNDVASI